MLKSLSAALFALAGALFASPSIAATYNYAFTGELTGSSGTVPGVSPFTFTGTMSFDLASADTDSSPDRTRFDLSAFQFSLSTPGHSLLLTGNGLYQGTNAALDDIYIQSSQAAQPLAVFYNGTPFTTYAVTMSLGFSQGVGALTSPLGFVDPWLAGFAQNLLRLNVSGSGVSGTYYGTLTSFAAVPLPAGLPLLAAGVGALGLLGWRGRSRKRASA
ncbi:MAG: VPLPA-CTERM sorting domain-containing protein [Devosia sp.]